MFYTTYTHMNVNLVASYFLFASILRVDNSGRICALKFKHT